MSKKGGFMIFGAIIGFLLGIFLAPKKGSELRKETKEKFDDIKENPQEVLNSAIETVKDKINELSEDDEDIEVSDDDIVISRTFDDEGEEF
ncbi:YtxH domain-containing protein [Peptacetobacter hominis]|uniref:YtxH domain-containing protein n=1 Tax=Peptacetobacter hominis TaxID=2743610 RepID=A0A544QV62_9FIRM|nr:YtxH domain-containing protein [Peptacetobacter hominis]TQQ84593.1 YtxH domain-containing protein [Peptacetobacter hominis]